MNLCELGDRQSNRNRPDRDAVAGCSGIGPFVLGPVPFTSSGWPKLNLKVHYCTDNDLDAARAPLSYS